MEIDESLLDSIVLTSRKPVTFLLKHEEGRTYSWTMREISLYQLLEFSKELQEKENATNIITV